MNNVRGLREAKGWRREQLAATTGLSLSTIYRLEVRGGGVDLASARRLAKAFGCTVDDVFPLEGAAEELAAASKAVVA